MQWRKHDLPDQKSLEEKNMERGTLVGMQHRTFGYHGVYSVKWAEKLSISGTREGIAGSGEKKMGDNEEINERM